jgi:hypothetical protein
MAVESGKNGKITIGASDLAEVRNIRMSFNANNQTYASSSTSGHQKSVKGMFGGTVSFDVVYDPADPIYDRLKPGDLVTLLNYVGASHKYTVPVRINTLDPEINIEDGSPPTVAVEGQTQGAWTYPDGTTSAG